ncbi:MAG: hypothetical protein V4655_01795 [Bdellovibrionota bacterium]|nr:MAG: hypothetical protein EOP10_07155 [Pseudomonadota bacterium]
MIKAYLLGLSLLLLNTSCGQTPTAVKPEASQTFSLTGIPEGTRWPCQDYIHGYNSSEMSCLRLPEAGNGHPSVDVLIAYPDFTPAQRAKIQDAVREFGQQWEQMRAEAAAPNESSLGKCIEASASRELFAVASTWPEIARNTPAAIAWAILNVQYMFEHHANTRTILTVSPIDRSGIMGMTNLGSDTANSENGNIMLGLPSLNNSSFTGLSFSGTLLHEWLHRKGYTHPLTGYKDPDFTSTLIVAAGQCMRNRSNSYAFSLFDNSNIEYE